MAVILKCPAIEENMIREAGACHESGLCRADDD
jgi:hypothetical protein